ncbi:MAG: FAD-binding oxidoreductase [SAR86 cluster bacterium]|jgi:FAD/FMN-containing dehydrogenase|nr:FAD-binding oxidoreductase [SAR86 cluster bacterium]|tara:strand:+ start:4727 stop:6103 length:1377 start_codon:yes stop_codon:yes gene_type:complete
MDILEEIKSIVGQKGILLGQDVSNRKAGIWIEEGIKAKAIVRPKNTEELSKVLNLCNHHKQTIVPHGGLTGLVQGAITNKEQIALSTERMTSVLNIDPIGRTMTVEAGVQLEKIQQIANEHELMFPLDLGARGSCSIGGNISTNAGGNMVMRYGMIRDSILGLESVLADGRILSSMNQMLKNNSGYDLKQLFIGTEGTLGFVTKAVLRLREKPKSCNTALASFDTFDEVTNFLKLIDQGLGGNLSSFEVMWKDYYNLVTNPPAKNNPPIGQDFAYYVLVESTGSNQEKDEVHFESILEEAINRELIKDAVIAKSQTERLALWSIRDDVEQQFQYGPVKIFDVSLPILSMEKYIQNINNELKKYWDSFHCTVFGHLADGNLHIIVGVGAGDHKTIQTIESCIYKPLEPIGGAISAEHGIGIEKKDYLSISRSKIEIDVMKSLKNSLDPNRILNPGKVFD